MYEFLDDFKGTDRFLIKQRIGAGGFGVVYQAFDRKRNTLVALKTLRQDDPQALYRFKREFRSLADISHPNLVSLYELISYENRWFFTMELIEGTGFLDYVRTTDRRRPDQEEPTNEYAETQDGSYAPLIDFGRLRSAFKQLVEGVFALHKIGKLHRDIKPPNIMVTNEGRVVLLDFGLLTELAPGFRQSGGVVGTPAYMAPEQADEGNILEASDWYSVGAVLYKTLTGKVPVEGNFFEVMLRKQRVVPKPPVELFPGIPEDLSALCSDLLQIDPKKRPTGIEILKRLGASEDEAGEPVEAAFSSTYDPVLIGRENHLDALREAYLSAKHGRSVAVYVKGRSGMGKTVLVRRFLDELQQGEQEATVFAGRCYEQESVPYKAFDAIVDALSRYLKSLSLAEAEALLPEDVSALARLFPVLRQVNAVASANSDVLEMLDSQELRRRAFAALKELLTRLACKKPLTVFIDDLQWGDMDSAVLLTELLSPPDPPPLLFIASYRSEEADTSPILKILLSQQMQINSTVEMREITVAELQDSETRQLVLKLLGRFEIGPQAHAEMIAEESGGSPFFISELVRYAQTPALRKRQIVALKSEAARLEEIIQARVSQLSIEARSLLEAAAVAGRPVLFETAKQASFEIEQEGQVCFEEYSVLQQLRNGRLIRTRTVNEGAIIEIYHDRIREAVIAGLSPIKLKSCHSALAVHLEASGRADPEMLMSHFQAAGDFKKAAHYAVEAAERAASALSFDRAARLYRLALDLEPRDRSDRQRLEIKLAEALADAGRTAEAARVFLACADYAEQAEALDLRQRAAGHLLHAGRIDEGVGVIRSVLKSADIKWPESPMQSLFSLMANRAVIRLRGYKYSERRAEEIDKQQLLRADICWSVSTGLVFVDAIRGLDFEARYLLSALRAGEPIRIARAFAADSLYLSSDGDRNRSKVDRLMQLSMEIIDRINAPDEIGQAISIMGLISFFRGRWREAIGYFERAEELLNKSRTGASWHLPIVRIYRFLSLFYIGELDKLAVRLPPLLKDAQERGDLYAETTMLTTSAYITSLAADDPETARRQIDRAMAGWSQKGFHLQHYFSMNALIEISLYCGEAKTSWDLLAGMWSNFGDSLIHTRIQVVRLHSFYAQARSALAAATESKDGRSYYLKTATRNAIKIEREKTAWGNGLARLIRASISTAKGDREKAASLLRIAEKELEAADMALHATAARRRLGEIIGGDEGRRLREAADGWMTDRKIKNPERMTALLAPGND